MASITKTTAMAALPPDDKPLERPVKIFTHGQVRCWMFHVPRNYKGIFNLQSWTIICWDFFKFCTTEFKLLQNAPPPPNIQYCFERFGGDSAVIRSQFSREERGGEVLGMLEVLFQPKKRRVYWRVPIVTGIVVRIGVLKFDVWARHGVR